MASRSPQYDPQRQEVYRWERNFGSLFMDHSMPYRKAHRLAKGMADVYGIRKPRLSWRKAKQEKWLAYADGDELIEVNTTWGTDFTGALVAHEMAHVIAHAYGVCEPPHGPVWLGIYLWLLDRFRIVPMCATMPSARKAGLKFKHPDKVKPGAL